MGKNEIRFADVVSGGEEIKIVVRMKGGNNATICPPMFIFRKKNWKYPFRRGLVIFRVDFYHT